MKKVLLYSGGMDSWLINQLWKPDVLLYINMHTKYSKEEMLRLPTNVEIAELDLSRWEREDAIIPLRNLYLIALATNYGDEICLGATAGDRVLDKSPQFAWMYEKLLTYLYKKQHWTEERKIEINLDFKQYSKTQLLAKYIEQGGDINVAFNNSFSCYNPQDGKECWGCKPCFRKFVAFALNGYQFDEEQKKKCLTYMQQNIIPLINAGKYGRKGEEEEILKVYKLLA